VDEDELERRVAVMLRRRLRTYAKTCQRTELPKRNEIDLEDVPKEIRYTLQFGLVEELSDIFLHALGKRAITPVPLVTSRSPAARARRRAALAAVKRAYASNVKRAPSKLDD
jgi:hypothetical protein